MSISKARAIAFDVLLRVANHNAYADEALRAGLDASLKDEDAGLAKELVLGVLRWQRLLDFVVDRSLRKSSRELDIEVRIVLRLGAYQLLFLDRIPAHAAVHESVGLTKRARKSSASSLVNAILRKAHKDWPRAETPSQAVARLLARDLPPAERLGIQWSHSTWMVERWLATFGEDRTRALLKWNNRAAALSCYLLEEERRADALTSLKKRSCRIEPGRMLRDSWTLVGGNPGASEAIRQGWVAIQDEASQAVAHLVGVRPGNSVLDLCAAPGGKTLILAKAAGPRGRVVAADLYERRVRAMKVRFELVGAQNVEALELNGLQPLPFGEPFERVLVDVPCSGTGTLSQHPEIRWKLRAEDLRDLHGRQVRLLRNALPHLAAGGRLVYSTCSLAPEENELVVQEALDGLASDFHMVSARSEIKKLLKDDLPVDLFVYSDGFFRTFPPESGTDGFFAAIIERRKT